MRDFCPVKMGDNEKVFCRWQPKILKIKTSHFARKFCLARVLEGLYIGTLVLTQFLTLRHLSSQYVDNISGLLTFQTNTVRHQNITGHMEESKIESNVKRLKKEKVQT